MGKNFPLVSVIVPCRNEKTHIEKGVRSILGQDSPMGDFEVVLVDGMSDDGTRDILERLNREDPRLRLVDNPARFTPFAMNAGIRAAKGRYIAIMGAHTVYSPNYLRTCVELLEEHPEVWCSGGPIHSQGKSLFGRAVAAAMSHPLGVGNAKHRFHNYEGYAEGACFPMFRREVFDAIGLYDERLIRNQDDELNLRMAQHGGKVFISPRAECTYFVRDNPIALFWQYFHYGYYRVAVLKKHRLPASLRQLAPVGFFFVLSVVLVGCWFLPHEWVWVGWVLPVAYGIILASGGSLVGMKEGWMTGLLFPVAAFILHFSYAVGFSSALLKGAFQAKGLGEKIQNNRCGPAPPL